MKELLKIVGIFCLVYLVWNLFWRSTFLLWDVLGPLTGSFIIYLVIAQFRRGSRQKEPPDTKSPTIGDLPRAPASPSVAPRPEEFVQLMMDMKELDSRCLSVFKDSLRARRDFRESRHSPPSSVPQSGVIRDGESTASDSQVVEDLDRFLDRICDVYLETAPEQRVQIRSLFDGHVGVLRNLNNYVGRVAQRLKASGNMKHLMLGLVAASIDENQVYSDYEGVLGLLYLAAHHLGLQPAPYFRIVAEMCGTDPCPIRKTLLDFESSEHFRVYVFPRLRVD